MKNIWIVNHHAVTPKMSGGTRHYDFAKELISRGYKVSIIASSYHYAKLEEMKKYPQNKYCLKEQVDQVQFIWIKTPAYKTNGISRVKNMLSFAVTLIKEVPKLNLERPDVIIGSSVHLFAVYGAYKLSQKYNTKFIMEVRDLWPLTLIEMGISKWHPFVILLGFLEKFLYKKASIIISTLPKAYKHIEKFVNKDKVIWISNGATVSSFSDEYKQVLDTNKFNIVYTGSHGLANSLETLVEVAYILKDKKDIFFTLVGDGPLRKSLQEKAVKQGLKNIKFIDTVAKSEINNYLKSADLLYVGLKNLALYRFGMSMNKIFDYMASKRAIIFVSNIDDNIIEESNAGIVIKDKNVEKIATAILNFSHLEKEKQREFGTNGYNYLVKNFDIKVLTDKLEQVIKD
ncbi:glycosyltransferase [Sulfurimonas aquatica]|uniref:Glycosyltransferase n=1 Tax=Sulfurimonas aquatica TaxID=2672570 RepID=A0A975AZL3_9BACT|nr:glycosyltransferase family 4 protein [Sulfurimonas aquatica]QSZ41443.1 glycosyltransferase [Sulfurimonas aquatica]